MALAFQPSSHPLVQPYRPIPGAERHEVAFRAEAGAFPVQVPALYRTVTYRKRLVFEESPLPRDAAEYHRGSLFFSVVNQKAWVQDGEQVVFFLPGTKRVAVRCNPFAGRTALPRLTVSEPYPGIRAHLRTVEVQAPLTPEAWVQATASYLLTW